MMQKVRTHSPVAGFFVNYPNQRCLLEDIADEEPAPVPESSPPPSD